MKRERPQPDTSLEAAERRLSKPRPPGSREERDGWPCFVCRSTRWAMIALGTVAGAWLFAYLFALGLRQWAGLPGAGTWR